MPIHPCQPPLGPVSAAAVTVPASSQAVGRIEPVLPILTVANATVSVPATFHADHHAGVAGATTMGKSTLTLQTGSRVRLLSVVNLTPHALAGETPLGLEAPRFDLHEVIDRALRVGDYLPPDARTSRLVTATGPRPSGLHSLLTRKEQKKLAAAALQLQAAWRGTKALVISQSLGSLGTGIPGLPMERQITQILTDAALPWIELSGLPTYQAQIMQLEQQGHLHALKDQIQAFFARHQEVAREVRDRQRLPVEVRQREDLLDCERVAKIEQILSGPQFLHTQEPLLLHLFCVLQDGLQDDAQKKNPAA